MDEAEIQKEMDALDELFAVTDDDVFEPEQPKEEIGDSKKSEESKTESEETKESGKTPSETEPQETEPEEVETQTEPTKETERTEPNTTESEEPATKDEVDYKALYEESEKTRKAHERLIQDLSDAAKEEGYSDVYDKMAHAKSVTSEEYKKSLSEMTEAEMAAEYRRMMQEKADSGSKPEQKDTKRDAVDLEAIYAIDPKAKDEIKDISQMENFDEFSRMRFSGVPLEQAYRYARREALAKREAAEKEKTAPKQDNRSHIQQTVKKPVSTGVTSMTAEELAISKDLFGDLTDAEIEKLYKTCRT